MSVISYTTPKGKKRWRARVWDSAKGEKGGWIHLGNRDRKGEAQKLIDEYRDLHRVPTVSDITVGRWRELWLETSEVDDSTKKWHEERTGRFVGEHGDKHLAAIGRPLALLWAAKYPSEAQALSAMWTAAVDARLALEQLHPWRGLVPRRKGRKFRPGWLMEQDIAGLCDAARAVHGPIYGPVMAAMIVTGAYVGLRPGELAGLRWVDLRPADDRIWVEQQANSTVRKMTPPKGGEQRLVVYPPVAQKAIAAMPRLHDDLVFVSKRGRVLFGANRNTIWSPVRAAAGRHSMVMHELRHYAATWLVEIGVSDSDAAAQLGHKDGGKLVREVYGHARPDPALLRIGAAIASAAPDIERTSEGPRASAGGK